MIAEVYDALIAAGAPEDKARKAAEAIAGYENRFTSLEMRLIKMDGELGLIKWMLGFVLAGVAALILKAFFS